MKNLLDLLSFTQKAMSDPRRSLGAALRSHTTPGTLDVASLVPLEPWRTGEVGGVGSTNHTVILGFR